MNNKSRQTIIHEATKHGYVNQAILFNAGFSFQEVQKINAEVGHGEAVDPN